MRLSLIVREAKRSLGASKTRTLLMMLGVTIGVAALTLIVAVGQGSNAQVSARLGKLWSANPIMVTASAAGKGPVPHMGMGVGVGSQTLTYEDMRAIETEVPNVRQASPGLLKSDVVVQSREQTVVSEAWGITPEFREYRDWDVESGEFLSDEDVRGTARVALLGNTLARKLFGEEDPTGATVRVDNVAFKVKGVLVAKGANPAGRDLDDRVMMPITTFAHRLYHVTYLSNIVVQVEDPRRMRETATAITALLRERHQIVPPKQDDFAVRTPEVMMEMFSGTTRTLTLFLELVAAIALLVGGLVIMNIMLVSVGERTREIGLRRAVGARRKDILRQFLAEAVAVTVAGGLVGVLAGVIGAVAMRALKGAPVQISWQAVVVALVFSIIVGVVFGVYPARRAARLHPVDALRTE
jgi:putative ABC transport system permease protein